MHINRRFCTMYLQGKSCLMFNRGDSPSVNATLEGGSALQAFCTWGKNHPCSEAYPEMHFSFMTPGGQLLCMSSEGLVQMEINAEAVSNSAFQKLNITPECEELNGCMDSKIHHGDAPGLFEHWRCVLSDGSTVKRIGEDNLKIFHPDGQVSEMKGEFTGDSNSKEGATWIVTSNTGERSVFQAWRLHLL